ncbi:MAG: VOC family protein [Candidatus Velthaea sp.]
MELHPNLFFAGNAEDALAHYHNALGGEVEIVRFAGTPAADGVPPEWAGKVLYGSLRSPFGVVTVMDAPPGREGTPGGNFAIEVQLESETHAAEIFSKLCAGGDVLMPFEQTFFAKKFGMTADKFGVKWMLNVAATVAPS